MPVGIGSSSRASRRTVGSVCPAFTARRASARPLILSAGGSAAVTVVFMAMLAWVVIETQGGGDLGLAERLTSSVQTAWPFVAAVTLQRSQPGVPQQGEQRP